MTSPVMSHAARLRRRALIVEAIRSGCALSDVAEHYGVSYRYVAMLAQQAKLNRKRGRPLGSYKQPKAWRTAPSARAGYSLQSAAEVRLL